MVGWAVKASLLLDEGLELAWVVIHNLSAEHFHMHQAVQCTYQEDTGQMCLFPGSSSFPGGMAGRQAAGSSILHPGTEGDLKKKERAKLVYA